PPRRDCRRILRESRRALCAPVCRLAGTFRSAGTRTMIDDVTDVIAIAPLERMASNPLVRPVHIPFARATGAFNPGAVVDRASGRVVLLVRVFEAETRRSSLA